MAGPDRYSDLESMSDAELMKIAGVTPKYPSGGADDLESMSDEELRRIAGLSPTAGVSKAPAGPSESDLIEAVEGPINTFQRMQAEAAIEPKTPWWQPWGDPQRAPKEKPTLAGVYEKPASLINAVGGMVTWPAALTGGLVAYLGDVLARGDTAHADKIQRQVEGVINKWAPRLPMITERGEREEEALMDPMQWVGRVSDAISRATGLNKIKLPGIYGEVESKIANTVKEFASAGMLFKGMNKVRGKAFPTKPAFAEDMGPRTAERAAAAGEGMYRKPTAAEFEAPTPMEAAIQRERGLHQARKTLRESLQEYSMEQARARAAEASTELNAYEQQYQDWVAEQRARRELRDAPAREAELGNYKREAWAEEFPVREEGVPAELGTRYTGTEPQGGGIDIERPGAVPRNLMPGEREPSVTGEPPLRGETVGMGDTGPLGHMPIRGGRQEMTLRDMLALRRELGEPITKKEQETGVPSKAPIRVKEAQEQPPAPPPPPEAAEAGAAPPPQPGGGTPPTPTGVSESKGKKAPSTLAEAMKDIGDKEFEDLISVAQGKKAAPTPTAEAAAGKGTGKKAAKVAKEAGGVMAEVYKGLSTMFTPKDTFGAGPTFTPESYAKAKVHFEKAWKHAQSIGQTLQEMIVDLASRFQDDIIPHLRAFRDELAGKKIKFPAVAAEAAKKEEKAEGKKVEISPARAAIELKWRNKLNERIDRARADKDAAGVKANEEHLKYSVDKWGSDEDLRKAAAAKGETAKKEEPKPPPTKQEAAANKQKSAISKLDYEINHLKDVNQKIKEKTREIDTLSAKGKLTKAEKAHLEELRFEVKVLRTNMKTPEHIAKLEKTLEEKKSKLAGETKEQPKAEEKAAAKPAVREITEATYERDMLKSTRMKKRKDESVEDFRARNKAHNEAVKAAEARVKEAWKKAGATKEIDRLDDRVSYLEDQIDRMRGVSKPTAAQQRRLDRLVTDQIHTLRRRDYVREVQATAKGEPIPPKVAPTDQEAWTKYGTKLSLPKADFPAETRVGDIVNVAMGKGVTRKGRVLSEASDSQWQVQLKPQPRGEKIGAIGEAMKKAGIEPTPPPKPPEPVKAAPIESPEWSGSVPEREPIPSKARGLDEINAEIEMLSNAKRTTRNLNRLAALFDERRLATAKSLRAEAEALQKAVIERDKKYFQETKTQTGEGGVTADKYAQSLETGAASGRKPKKTLAEQAAEARDKMLEKKAAELLAKGKEEWSPEDKELMERIQKKRESGLDTEEGQLSALKSLDKKTRKAAAKAEVDENVWKALGTEEVTPVKAEKPKPAEGVSEKAIADAMDKYGLSRESAIAALERAEGMIQAAKEKAAKVKSVKKETTLTKEGVDEAIEKLEGKKEALEEKLDELNDRDNPPELRVERLEDQIADIEEKLDTLEELRDELAEGGDAGRTTADVLKDIATVLKGKVGMSIEEVGEAAKRKAAIDRLDKDLSGLVDRAKTLGNLTPSKMDSLIMAAHRSGRSVDEFGRKLGLSADELEFLKKRAGVGSELPKEVERPATTIQPKPKAAAVKASLGREANRVSAAMYKEERAKGKAEAAARPKPALKYGQHSTDNPYQTGAIVKQRQVASGDTPLWAPAVREGEAAIVRALKNLPRDIGKWSIEVASETFDKLGETAKELFYRPLATAQHNMNIEVESVARWLKKTGEGLNAKARKRIGAWMIAQREGGKVYLKKTGVEVPTLTATEMRAANALSNSFKEFYDRLNDARVRSGLKPFGKQENYITFFENYTRAQELGWDPINTPTHLLEKKFAHMRSTPFRFTESRRDIYKVRTDAFDIYKRYAGAALKHIHLGPEIAKGRELLGNTYNPKTKKSFSLKDTNTNTYNFLTQWLDFAAGTKINMHLKPWQEKAIGQLTNNIAISTMGGNFRSASIQPTAILNSWVHIGTKHLTLGILDLMNPESRGMARLMSNHLLGRNFDASAMNVYRDSILGRTGKVIQGVKKATMTPLSALDYVTALATWRGAYRKGISEGMSKNKAANYADDVVVRTQGSASMLDRAPIQQHTLGRAATIFQTFTLANWSFLKRNVAGISNPHLKPHQRLGRALMYIGGASLINTLYETLLKTQSPFPSPITAAQEALDEGQGFPGALANALLELTQPVPIIGSMRFGSSPAGAVAQLLGDISFKASSRKGPSKSVYELGGKVGGVPGTVQIAKTLRAVKKGATPLEALFATKPPSKRIPEGLY